MALSFTGRRWHDEQTGTVTFPAWSGETRVPCRITDEALMFLFGAVRTDSGLVAAFDRHKQSIEVAAAWKFEAERDALSITLGSSDFPEKKPPPEAVAPAAAARETGEAKQTSAEEAANRMDRFRRAYHVANAVHASAQDAAKPTAGEPAAPAAGNATPSSQVEILVPPRVGGG